MFPFDSTAQRPVFIIYCKGERRVRYIVWNLAWARRFWDAGFAVGEAFNHEWN